MNGAGKGRSVQPPCNELKGEIMETVIAVGLIIIVSVIFLAVLDRSEEQKNAPLIKAQQEKYEAFYFDSRDRITEIITKHLPALAVKHQQSITQDSYGVIDVSAWDDEIKYFVDKVLWPEAGNYLGGIDLGRSLDEILAEFDRLINAQNAGKKIPDATMQRLKEEKDLIEQKHQARVGETTRLINSLVTEYRAKQI